MPGGAGWFKSVLGGFRWCRIMPDGAMWSRVVLDAARFGQLLQGGTNASAPKPPPLFDNNSSTGPSVSCFLDLPTTSNSLVTHFHISTVAAMAGGHLPLVAIPRLVTSHKRPVVGNFPLVWSLPTSGNSSTGDFALLVASQWW